MDWKTLQALLLDLEKQVGEGNIQELTIKGRVAFVVSCSVPDGKIPVGWRRVNENKIQARPGWQRVVISTE